MTLDITCMKSRTLVRYVAPASEPVSLADAKLYLRVDGSADDTLLSNMIASCREAAEAYLRMSLMVQSWKLTEDLYGQYDFRLAMGPVTDISSVSLFDEAGGETSLDVGSYRLNAAKDLLQLKQLYQGSHIEIVYQAGFASADAVPQAIKQGILSHVMHVYDHRGDMEMPVQVASLYQPFRKVEL